MRKSGRRQAKKQVNDLLSVVTRQSAEIAQLLGYSVCGYTDLIYATEKSKDQAWEIMNRLPGRK